VIEEACDKSTQRLPVKVQGGAGHDRCDAHEAHRTAASLIIDRGYDRAGLRKALKTRGIEPCIPSSLGLAAAAKSHTFKIGALSPALQGREPLRQAQGRATHCNSLNQRAHTFFSAIGIAAAVFWL